MAVTPNALFEAARVIGQGESEVDLRNAASRAYYAAYHHCRLLGQSLRSPAPPLQGGVHRTLIATLTEARSSKLKSLGYMLEQCRRLRVSADYDIGSEFPHRERSRCPGPLQENSEEGRFHSFRVGGRPMRATESRLAGIPMSLEPVR